MNPPAAGPDVSSRQGQRTSRIDAGKIDFSNAAG